ncbi:JmjC-domain-containing protein [Punctularia strigosozonata HHB-11173 SS5]|uniref:[histone H3]-trimethyl-L-lysine(9) demethylase n=1 Tax=Punctularia strigosozonata (strain HHB-11173) TaxID=741275 RepID=R7S562_PUNST|nr:JmjC-domain-containing protein [Punctularia strigosozonata HHB-11173 SS5]EIN04471.1 JmjC-domain-containing protein [Punctularia strigosozonata HHB-11173 SS5]
MESVLSSRTPSLTPSRSPTPMQPVQPDHFYGSDIQLPLSPQSNGKTWLDPADDPLAQRGIPVFKPTMAEFRDFEGYMKAIECWGMRSGIVKVIPPQEWRDSLPPVEPQLANVEIKNPIEQNMLGGGGLFRQTNVGRRKMMTVKEWFEYCSKDEYRAPGVEEIGPYSAHRTTRTSGRTTRRGRTAKAEPQEPVVKDEPMDDSASALLSPPRSTRNLSTPAVADEEVAILDNPPPEFSPPSAETKKKARARRAAKNKEAKDAEHAAKMAANAEFVKSFSAHKDWLPPKTSPESYTPEFCRELERHYWRNLGLGKPAWYGADTAGSLFTDQTTSWNVAHLPSLLTRLLPASSKGLPGVNTPYLYFGMWRATFAWHVEDMDLFSINYIHFGAGKHWYAIPQGRASALEQTMKGFFPKDISQCPQFLRHKSYLASPKTLAGALCKPNTLVQHAGEFVITYPRGYHAGFNLGFNCAESVNFALDSWVDLARKAQVCKCVGDSVSINIDELLREREEERIEAAFIRHDQKNSKENVRPRVSGSAPRKRKPDGEGGPPKKKKKVTVKDEQLEVAAVPKPKITVKLKLGPKPEEDSFPCCLCVSSSTSDLLRVHDLPLHAKDARSNHPWMAHEHCASVVPETWVDEIEVGEPREDGTRATERVVFGVDGIVKDRWNLKCSACTKPRAKAHGAPIQCTKGKCSKAFHVSCARHGSAQGIIFSVLREVEKEVVLLGETVMDAPPTELVSAPSTEGASETHSSTVPSEPASSPRVLKVIKKTEVQVLCSQHNPARLEAKKSAKQDKMKNHLLALDPMTRIKIRVSAGVFEVSLIRVISETGSVEVLWDKGVKREFKWSSVILGNTPEGVPVGQMPKDPAPENLFTPRHATLAPAPSISLTEPIMPTAAQWDALFSYQRQKNLALWPTTSLQQGTQMIWPSQAQLQAAMAALSKMEQSPPSGAPSSPAVTTQPEHFRPPTQIPPLPPTQVPSGLPSAFPIGVPGQPYVGYPATAYQALTGTNGDCQSYGPPAAGAVVPRSQYPNGQITWQQPYAGPPQKHGFRTGCTTPAPLDPPSRASSTIPGSMATGASSYPSLTPSASGAVMPSTGTLSYSQLASMAAVTSNSPHNQP